MAMKISKNRGFTLIEMLVVIAIIAILSGIIIANLSGAKGKARDAKRISDMGNIQMALALYFDRCNAYPDRASTDPRLGFDLSGRGCSRTNTNVSPARPYLLTDFISPIPTPTNERGQANYYYYTINNPGDNSNDYVLEAILESSNAAVGDGLND